MSLRIDKRSASRLRPELRTRCEIDIRERPLGTRYVRLRFLAKASTLAFDSVSSVGCVYTSSNSNEAVQISSTRQRKNVGDKSRFKRCVFFFSRPNFAVSSAGSLSGKYKLQSAPKSPFLKKMRLFMTWDRKVSKTVRPLLD